MAPKARRTLRNVDYFRKVPRDLTEGSVSGGWISMVATAILLFLVVGECGAYFRVKTVTDVYADTSNNGKLRINFDVFFSHLSCEHLSVDVMDGIGSLKVSRATHPRHRLPIRAALAVLLTCRVLFSFPLSFLDAFGGSRAT